MTTEVATKETNLPTTYQSQSEQVLKSDVVIPRVLLMQGLSDFVNERKAQAGDMVRSTDAYKLGDDKTPVEFIPLTFQNLWMISENQTGDGSKFEFRRYEPRTAKNEDAPWEYTEAGTRWKRTKVMNVYALLPKDVEVQNEMLKKFKETGEVPDVNNVLLPVVISFRSTSFNAGKTVATHFAKAASLSSMVGKEIPAFGSTLKLSCYQDKNEKGTYFVYKIEAKGKTEGEFLSAAKTWYDTLTSGAANIKVDESVSDEVQSTNHVDY